MNQLSLEKTHEEPEEILKEYRNAVDQTFAKQEELENQTLKSIDELIELANSIYGSFKFDWDNIAANTPKDYCEVPISIVVVKSQLNLLSRLAVAQLRMQRELALATLRNTSDLKETAYLLVRIPLETAMKTVSIFVEIAPKLSEEAKKMIEEKLITMEKEIQQMKESKDKITLEISSDYEEALKELTERIKRAKKAIKSYAV